MMIRSFIVLFQLLLMINPAAGMRIDADPRMIISFMDRSLPPELDILRVTTDISEDNHLIFRVQIRGERISGDNNDYVLLNIQHEKTYVLMIPLSKEAGETIRIYEGELLPTNQLTSIAFTESDINSEHAGFSARHINRGVEFMVPLDWINFGADFGFDAYTISATIQKHVLHIDEIHDQARRGNLSINQVPAITLLNAICSPKK
ncbi:MAG: DUF1292 domain-containing protein [Nitrosomonas sp.]|nr:DUF1292 domain-containing protein [Nitrosomonas sp.]